MADDTDIISALPAVREVDAEIEDLRRRQASYLSSVAEQRAVEENALATWQAARDEALAAGKIPPDPPQHSMPPSVHADAVATFAAEDRRLADKRRRVIAEHVDSIVEVARQVIEKSRGRSSKPIAAIETEARTIAAARSAVAHAHNAADAEAGVQRDRPSPAFGPVDLVAAPADADLIASLGTTARLGMTRWESAESRNAPEPSEAQKRMTAMHNARQRPGQIVGRGF